jgi:asparagine synthase (glutamine-hydrolysing)
MCGIFGAINTTGFFESADFHHFVKLTNMVQYRGPDDSGHIQLQVKGSVVSDENLFDVFLGSRRLSILDLSSSGHQPMSDGKGRWITYNGEVFNYLELRRELEAKGHQFTSATDTEVVLRIYDEYGEGGFEKLNGMWAFALVDAPGKRVVLSRDRFSIKPLYLLRMDDRLLFASEIKQLLPLLLRKQLNTEVMTDFLAQGLLDHRPETFFEGIRRAPARTNVIVCMNTGKIVERPYWKFDPELIEVGADAVERFRDLFFDSVRIRLRSDVRVGVLLSGGVDSSAITVACDQVSAGQVETYSIIADDKKYDEESFIDAITATGIKNRKITFRADDFGSLEEVLYHSDEPFGGLSVVAQYKLLGAVKQAGAATVLLSGQGGDEVLLGYLKFFFFQLRNLAKKRQYLAAITQVLQSLLRRTMIRQFTFREARRYLPSFQNGADSMFKCRNSGVPIWECGDMRSRQILDIEKYSVPALTHYEDRNSSAHSLEVRHPFLDHRLVQFLVSLPVESKINSGWTKYILRQSMHELPGAIRWRRDKKPFITPEEMWLKKNLSGLIKHTFKKSMLNEMDFLDDGVFLAYYDNFQNGRAIPHGDISRALIAEVWLNKHFN